MTSLWPLLPRDSSWVCLGIKGITGYKAPFISRDRVPTSCLHPPQLERRPYWGESSPLDTLILNVKKLLKVLKSEETGFGSLFLNTLTIQPWAGS